MKLEFTIILVHIWFIFICFCDFLYIIYIIRAFINLFKYFIWFKYTKLYFLIAFNTFLWILLNNSNFLLNKFSLFLNIQLTFSILILFYKILFNACCIIFNEEYLTTWLTFFSLMPTNTLTLGLIYKYLFFGLLYYPALGWLMH